VYRRLLAILAILVLSATFVSADGSLWAAGTPDCCASGLCPMMRHMAGAVLCDMDMSHPGAQFQTCPTPASRYTSALVFVRIAPLALLAGQRVVERLSLSTSPAVPVADLEVLSPPPRAVLA